MGDDQSSFRDEGFKFHGGYEKDLKWVTIMEDSGLEDLSGSASNDDEDESIDSAGSSCSNSSDNMVDQEEDASSSFSSSSRLMCSSSSSLSSGPLFELSDLMAQLPIKRGLSKFYDGRSQSYTTLTSVRRLKDLMKRERPYNKRLKLCKSYEGDLDLKPSNKSYSLKATISKKGPNRGSSFLSSLGNKRTMATTTRSPTPALRIFLLERNVCSSRVGVRLVLNKDQGIARTLPMNIPFRSFLY